LIKSIIFDLGGVLVRTHDQSGRRKWEERLGLAERACETVVFDSVVSRLAEEGRATTADVWRNVAEELGLDPETLVEFQRDFWRGDVLDPELVALLERLRPRYKLALLSNAWDSLRPVLAGQLAPLDQAFDLIMISAEEGIRKPDPRLFRRLLARLEVAPEEAVFIDDMPANVAGARAVGLHAIQFTGTPETISALRALGVEA
jgi:putative hydrolase of the HAD superfamily